MIPRVNWLLLSVGLCLSGIVTPIIAAGPKIRSTVSPKVYLSADQTVAMEFDTNGARIGPTELMRLTSDNKLPLREFSEGEMRCVSVGRDGESMEFAIKRPLKVGDQFRCRKTIFKVSDCLAGCRSAILDVQRPLTNGKDGHYPAVMLVDSCRGLIAAGGVGNWRDGIPLSAALLRGKTGILATSDDCPL